MVRSIPISKNNLPRHKDFIDTAREESLKSIMKNKHGAIIVYRNKIISTGYNYILVDKKKFYSVHAEVCAIREFLKISNKFKLRKDILKECSLYVVRTGTKNMDYPIKLSKPCEHCANFISKYNLKKVYWSINAIS